MKKELSQTRMVLKQYQQQYPILSPATVYEALADTLGSQYVDTFKLSELLSALFQDLEGEEIGDME